GNPHVCIIGQNGVGKSTLIKEIYNTLRTRTDIKVGYMPQNYEDILKEYDKVIDFIAPSGKKEDVTKARMYLGNMNVTREEMEGKIAELSNGTKAKLILMKLVLEKSNVLLLDEPTRNVSPLSNPVIRKVLKEFKGTIISVSHDRKYIEEVIDKLYTLTPNGLILEKL
ncbi:MAG TPA: ABC-F family ATP-binding cassette domain-containing protein, partial [Candidatus Faecimonas intestinavium]|nr:ABC-F family ATP-binding cassette domain-containing protein [Candidatus Faecimonas intestinavium]